MSFDPWGARRKETSSLPVLSVSELFNFSDDITSRGYTGHEMLDEVGLIHMNGRLYDARLARFIQADPFVDGAKNIHGYNRYAYGQNNPLNGTDPSGFSFIRKAVGVLTNGIFGEIAAQLVPELRPIMQMAACIFGGPVGCGLSAFGNTYASGASFGESFRAGAFAWVSAEAFTHIGSKFTATGPGAGFFDWGTKGGFYHLGAHAVTGGVMAELQGGSFGHGFVSAGLTKGLTRTFSGVDGFMLGDISVAQAAVAAIIGGTVSKVTGGKFANGARTAAFANVFNQQTSENRAQEEKTIKNVKIGFTKKTSKGIEGTLTVDQSGEVSGSVTAQNPVVTGTVDSSGNVEAKLTFWERVKAFFSPPVKVNSDGNIVVGKSVGPVGVEVEIDPAAPIKNSPIGQIMSDPMKRRECAAGLRTEGC